MNIYAPLDRFWESQTTNFMIDIFYKQLVAYAEGNIAATAFLATVYAKNDNLTTRFFSRMETIPTLRGGKIWVLWKDLSNEKEENLMKLLQNCSNEVLRKAIELPMNEAREFIKPFLM